MNLGQTASTSIILNATVGIKVNRRLRLRVGFQVLAWQPVVGIGQRRKRSGQTTL
jgi:hypothetical protein